MQIMSEFKFEEQTDWRAKLFQLLVQNQNFLKVLQYLPTDMDLRVKRHYGSCEENAYIFSNYFGHSVTKVLVIFLRQVDLSTREYPNQIRQGLNHCGENPTYIFLIISVLNNETFRITPDAKSTSKLFVVHGGHMGTEGVRIFMVCLPCRLSPLVELHLSVEELSELLDSAWKLHNSNLQGLRIISSGSNTFNSGKQTCSAIQRGVRAFTGYNICIQLALGDKFSFTDIKILGVRNFIPSHPYDSMFQIQYNTVVRGSTIEDSFLYPVSARFSWLPHCGERYQFRMATVSYRKSNLEGLKALVMPLDQYTWAASGISFTLMAIIAISLWFVKNDNE